MEFLNDKKKLKLKAFVKFIKKDLGIKKMPKIFIQNHRKDLKTTANYNYMGKEQIIKICGKKRALVDIMRSLAHELVHHKQFEDGKLKVKPADISGKIEDEANAIAGKYIKMFALIDNTIYDE